MNNSFGNAIQKIQIQNKTFEKEKKMIFLFNTKYFTFKKAI